MIKSLYILLCLLVFSCSKTGDVNLFEVETNTIEPPLYTTFYNLNTTSLRGKPSRDNLPPTISINSPLSNTEVSGVINVSVQSFDNVGVTSIILKINDTTYSTVYGVSAYTFGINTDKYAGNNVTITVLAYDKAGNAGKASIQVFVKNKITLPSTGFELRTPAVINQGGEGSCVAMSVGYYTRSIEQYYRTGALFFENSINVFSPEHLYNEVKFGPDCGSGTAMQTALDYIKANGILPYADMPYSSSNGCSLYPTAEQLTKAAQYKIAGYTKLYTTDSVAMKQMLKANHPVIISVITDNNFINAKAGFIWNFNTSGPYSIAHSIAIIGFDDTKHAWKIVNSFGTLWGDAGFCYIDYDFFITRTGTYCYVIN